MDAITIKTFFYFLSFLRKLFFLLYLKSNSTQAMQRFAYNMKIPNQTEIDFLVILQSVKLLKMSSNKVKFASLGFDMMFYYFVCKFGNLRLSSIFPNADFRSLDCW